MGPPSLPLATPGQREAWGELSAGLAVSWSAHSRKRDMGGAAVAVQHSVLGTLHSVPRRGGGGGGFPRQSGGPAGSDS